MAYLWNLPLTEAARVQHARQLVANGVLHVRVKAGGDDGRLWESWADPRATQPYRDAGLRVTPWFYTWPTEADIDVVLRAMRAQPFDEYALNPETEWRTDSQHNTWNTVAEANEGAHDWLRRMEATLPSVRRGFSSVPSWTGFPYEAWCAGSAQAEPQHYWPRNMLADVYGKDYDEVGYHRLRGGDALPCVPLITACQEYNDPAVVALAKGALADFPSLDGFGSWECGNAGYQWDAMAAVYKLLPESFLVEQADDKWARSWIDERGVPTTQILWGGTARVIKGTNFNDVGITVIGGPPLGEYDRSIKAGVWQPWVYRPLLP